MWHKCSRYWRIGVGCPFSVIEQQPEDEDDENRDTEVLIPEKVREPRNLKPPEEVIPVYEPEPEEIVYFPPMDLPLPVPPFIPPLPPPILPPGRQPGHEPGREPIPESEPARVPVGAPQGGTPFPARYDPLPDWVNQALKNTLATRRSGFDPEKGDIFRTPPPRTQEAPSLRLQAGIQQMQLKNERTYAHALAASVEQDFVRGIEAQQAVRETNRSGSNVYQELGILGAAVVTAAALSYGLHIIRGMGPPPTGAGAGGFFFQAPTYRRSNYDRNVVNSCAWCEIPDNSEIVE